MPPFPCTNGLLYAGGLNGPFGLAFDPAGNLLVSINGTNPPGTTVDIIPAGSPAPATATSLVTGLSQPASLVEHFGYLYIANSGSGQVQTSAPTIPTLSTWAIAAFAALLGAGAAWQRLAA